MGTRGRRYDEQFSYAKSIDDVVIAIMVEKKNLMMNLEDVLVIDGLDMIQFGPVDYGLSLRIPGKPYLRAEYSDIVTKDMDRAHQMALDAGVRPRAEAGSAEQCQYFMERGVRDFCIGWDASIVEAWCTQNGRKLREMLSKR